MTPVRLLRAMYWTVALGWIAISGYVTWMSVARIGELDGSKFELAITIGAGLLSAIMAPALAYWITRWVEFGSAPT